MAFNLELICIGITHITCCVASYSTEMVSSSLFNHRSSSIFSLLVCHVVVQESGELLCRPPPSPSRTWSALPSPQPPVSCRPTTQTSGNERVNCWDTQLTASRRDPYSKSRPPRSTPLLSGAAASARGGPRVRRARRSRRSRGPDRPG